MFFRLKKIVFLITIFLLVVLLPSCWSYIEKDKKNKEKIYKDFIIINVLDKKLYDDCHIIGSINVTMPYIESYAKENIDKKAEIVFYCSNYMCSASEFARKKLFELGFLNVFVYEGGMADWYQRGYPSIGKAKSSYLEKKLKNPKFNFELYELNAEQLKEKIEIFEAA